MPDHRPRSNSDDDTPPLFGDAEDSSAEESSGEDSAGIERLVTRVPDRPRHWAMNWRPTENEGEEQQDADRHPARVRGADDAGDDSPTLVLVEPDPAGVVNPIPAPASDPASSASMPEPEPTEPASTPEVMTSRTWTSPSENDRRHPATPSGTSSGRRSSSPSLPPSRSGARFTAVAGWLVALGIGVAWMVFGGASPSDGNAEKAEASVTEDEVVLARPAGTAFEATLAREEIASLRQERSRLMQEVDAARILLEDHRRLSASLEESTATNAGAALELGVLENDAERWRRRHETAMARLDELASLLLEAEAREATLSGELVDTQRRLDALDAVNGAD